MALKLPLQEGWTVLCRDGSVRRIMRGRHCDEVCYPVLLPNKDRSHAVWVDYGRRYKDTDTTKDSDEDVMDVLSINPGELDWDKPLAVYHDGKIIRVKAVWGSGNQRRVTFVKFLKFTASITSDGPYSYNSDGTNVFMPEDIPILFNLYEGSNDTTVPSVRKRVRRKKPTIDENFTEILSMVDSLEGSKILFVAQPQFNRIKFLVKQIVKELAGPADVSKTLERIYQDARAEAQIIIDKAKDEGAGYLSDIAHKEAMLNKDRELFSAVMVEELAKIDEQIELGVQKRIKKMYGTEAALGRKRALKIG